MYPDRPDLEKQVFSNSVCVVKSRSGTLNLNPEPKILIQNFESRLGRTSYPHPEP